VSDSTIYTIGTALNRAHDNDIPVQVLVEGEWMTGNVVAVDGHGVVLHSAELEHAVVRMDAVSAVRIFTAAPGRTPLAAGAHPMPGPRTPAYE
jgi:sRNA-binding regulator protein Hfq